METPRVNLLRERSEQWLSVLGYRYYEVSDRGRVRSLPRVTGARAGKTRKLKGRMLRPHSDKRGYRRVVLMEDCSGKTWCTHELVARAFMPPRPAGMDIRHLDGDTTNDNVRNLMYGTRSENMMDAARYGQKLGTPPRLTESDVRFIRHWRKRGHKLTEIADVFDIDFSTVSDICNGRSWSWLK